MDYKQTIFLPKPNFSMQGVEDESAILNLWNTTNLYGSYVRTAAKRFVLHDGPPYANGDLHLGHALNKILKDIVVRSRFALGHSVEYRPGWDCHGLPIEWQVERNLMDEGRNKNDLSPVEFRALCRDYADGWVSEQREQFKELGVIADWDNPYKTMSFDMESKITQQFLQHLQNGQVYRGTKPVTWSTVEETALAGAEVEHKNLKSTHCWVGFQVHTGPTELQGTSVVVWTTTPWTLPANRALAYNPNIEYVLLEATSAFGENKNFATDTLIVAKNLVEKVVADLQLTDHVVGPVVDMTGVICHHPLHRKGYDFEVPVLPGDHVTDDTGTGFVHIAPEHGPEDFVFWQKHGLGEVPTTVLSDGTYASDVPLFAGLNVLKQVANGDWIFEYANDAVLSEVADSRYLLQKSKEITSYPHSWRSKAPVIYRNTPQWFLRLDEAKVRAADEINKTTFLPESGKNRLAAAVEGRPDWLVSRQRLWGTPMGVFVHKETQEPLVDPLVFRQVVKAFKEHGGDAWWTLEVKDFLETTGYDHTQYEKVEDVLDVWFDSGCTHVVLNTDQADLYLEGSDQHRGWFGSSLLQRCLNNTGKAPFKTVLTHGFLLDHKGFKMSKSAGNGIDPRDVVKKYGTDTLRLWVAMADYTSDLKAGDEIFKTTHEAYRKIRNTLRYLVGSLSENEVPLNCTTLPPLEQFIMEATNRLSRKVKLAYQEYDFREAVQLMLDFCSNTLSSFYFDIKKDSLYCDRTDSPDRLACLYVLDFVFGHLTTLLSPILPFTTEEAWREVHQYGIPNSTRPFRFTRNDNTEVFDRWDKVQQVLNVVTGALEHQRQAKVIGGALDAAPKVYLSAELYEAVSGLEVADIFRTSQATVLKTKPPKSAYTDPDIPGVAVVVELAKGTKCARSRKILLDVGQDTEYPDLSLRDADAVRFWLSQNQTLDKQAS